MFSKMVDMSMSAPKDTVADAPMPSPPDEQYPYGLCLCFDDVVLKKLGITEMPALGDMCHLMAMARVTSVSHPPGGTPRIELQITDLGVENENDEEEEMEQSRPNMGKRYKEAAE